MAKNLGDNVSSVLEGLGYNYDKVVFQQGKPFLDSEINIAQELQEILTQKSTAHLPSGWLSFRHYYTSNTLTSSFYTQDPEGAKPEVALVNGWPIYVTNTATSLKHINKIDLSANELRSGSRVDGVFLEVWRSLLTPGENDGINKPDSITKIGDINSITMFDSSVGWAVGENSIILKTYDGGQSWVSQETPIATSYNRVKFYNQDIGYAVGNGGYIIKTINGGQTWNIVYSNIDDNLNDVYIMDYNKVCAVGDNGAVLLSIDGDTFELIKSVSGVTNNLNGVYFYDTFIGWAVGDGGRLIITNDGGNSWSSTIINDSQTSLEVTQDLNSVGFYNYNEGIIVGSGGIILKTTDGGASWSNVSARIYDDGAYKSIDDIFVNETNTFNRVFIKKEFPINFNIAVYPQSVTYFKNISYSISPSNYPNKLIFDYTGALDNKAYKSILDLNSYATAEELRDAINGILSPYLPTDINLDDTLRQKARVFLSSIGYTASKPSDFQETTGSVTSTSSANLNFSIEDKAWIIGTNGVFLKSNNSGYKWEVVENNYGYDFKDTSFVNDSTGWLSGNDGVIIKYDSNFEVQTTDLLLSNKGRVFPEGNILSESLDYLEDNTINPQVGVETTKRVQIQYRIRVVDGIDPFMFQEAGLGSDYIYSLGPNETTEDSGNYKYDNMGTENGDYGVWRARCRNTVDGYSWAIPMFFVTRRNSSPYNISSNINGSTFYNLNAIRPDGLTYQEVVQEDITDIRRKINIHSYSSLYEKNVDNLLMNNLKTSISNRDERGSQHGSYILGLDTYTGTTDINKLIAGQITSEASIVELTKDVPADPEPTQDELTFGPIEKALFHNDMAYYSALAIRIVDDVETVVEEMQGTFVGLGTNTVIFLKPSNYTPSGGTENVVYRLTTSYMDYSKIGLSRTPKEPIGIRYVGDSAASSQFYRGINKFLDSCVIEELDERVSGYKDYTVINSAEEVISVKDQEIYEEVGTLSESDTDYVRSTTKFRTQQFRGSLVEYHYFTQVTVATSILRVPKNLNKYTVFMVKEIKNAVTGAPYKVSTNYSSDQTIRDREVLAGQISSTLTNLIIYLDEVYIIPANNIVEIVLEVTSTENGEISEFGFTENNLGETQASLRSSFVSNYNPTAKSVRGFYKSVLYPDSESESLGPTEVLPSLELDLGDYLAMGIASFPTREKSNQMYLWYKSSDPSKGYYAALPIASVEGLGTSTLTINMDPRVSIKSGKVYVPILVKMNDLPSLVDTSKAYVYYKYIPYQTVKTLPSELSLEVVKCSEFVYISNLGTGSSNVIKPEPYEMPIEHIAVNDSTILNDNMFSNVDDINMSTYTVDTGFLKLPAIISRTIGSDIILSSPNNVGDNLGRTYYTKCSEDITFEAERLDKSTPRKVFIPMLARIRSDITTPFLRGELVLVVFSKAYKARVENKTGYYYDNDTEYQEGYYEYVDTAISVYRLVNKPLVRV